MRKADAGLAMAPRTGTVRATMRGWGWTLFSGMVDLVLAYLIWRGWPDSAAWAIGLLVGINMFFLGLSLAMTAIAVRTTPGR